MGKLVLSVLLGISWASVGEEPPAKPPDAPKSTLSPRVQIETTLGNILLELDGERAPGTTLNFVQYARDKFYDGTIFHRVIDGFIIQGGSHLPDVSEKGSGVRSPIKNEWRNGLRNQRGTVAMARLGNLPDSARASFYINLVDNEFLDRPMDGAGYCVFGRVIDGMETVEKIRATPVAANPNSPQDQDRPVLPITPVVIHSARVLDEFDDQRAIQLALSFEALIRKREELDQETQAKRIQDRIKAIENEHKASMTVTSTGLKYLDVANGTGESPGFADKIVVHYRGTFADEREFDNSRDNPDLKGQPWEVELAEVIPGWVEGLQSMKVGGKRILVVPPELGFGERGRQGRIPPNATLFYEVELLGVKKPSTGAVKAP